VDEEDLDESEADEEDAETLSDDVEEEIVNAVLAMIG